MKRLMLGNEAVARGLYEAGCRVVSSYPGTPSTEISEYVAKYEEVYAEWAPNEKVAAEVAIGASFGGARSFCAMKHVGLNVAADPVFTSSYTGVNGGMILAVADDQGMHSSQNEQDSRHYAIAAKLPMVEPSDSKECKDFIKAAYEISEDFDTPVLFRLSTRVSHSQSIAEECPREEKPLKDYVKNPQKYIMMPAYAKKKHPEVEARTAAIAEFAAESALNRVERGTDAAIGIITSGTSYQYVREVFGDSASVLKLGIVNPLPEKLIRDFADSVEKLYVVEELDGIIENFCRAHGVEVAGGKYMFSPIDEFSQRTVAQAFGKALPDAVSADSAVPVRPPMMCSGCPHRGLFYTLAKNKITVLGDIGCYTLGAQQPLNALDSTLCLGIRTSRIQ